MKRRTLLKSLTALALTPFSKFSLAAHEAKLVIDRPKKFFQYVWALRNGKEVSNIFPSFKKALKNSPLGAKHSLWEELGPLDAPPESFEPAICQIPIYYDWQFHENIFEGMPKFADLELVEQAEDWEKFNENATRVVPIEPALAHLMKDDLVKPVKSGFAYRLSQLTKRV